MRTVSGFVRKLTPDRRGVSSTELGVVLALVALGSLQALSSLGQEVEDNLDVAKTEVERNRAYADPFARHGGGAKTSPDNGSNRAINPGSDVVDPEPAVGSDGSLPEPAAASAAPDAVAWGGPNQAGGDPEPAAAVRVVPPRPRP